MTTFEPNEDRILVEPRDKDSKIGSIIIPETAKGKPYKGTVLAVGEGVEGRPMTFKPGDKIIYGQYAGTEITIDKKDLLVMRTSDVFGTISDF